MKLTACRYDGMFAKCLATMAEAQWLAPSPSASGMMHSWGVHKLKHMHTCVSTHVHHGGQRLHAWQCHQAACYSKHQSCTPPPPARPTTSHHRVLVPRRAPV